MAFYAGWKVWAAVIEGVPLSLHVLFAAKGETVGRQDLLWWHLSFLSCDAVLSTQG